MLGVFSFVKFFHIFVCPFLFFYIYRKFLKTNEVKHKILFQISFWLCMIPIIANFLNVFFAFSGAFANGFMSGLK